jgi:hypothetical protein
VVTSTVRIGKVCGASREGGDPLEPPRACRVVGEVATP